MLLIWRGLQVSFYMTEGGGVHLNETVDILKGKSWR